MSKQPTIYCVARKTRIASEQKGVDDVSIYEVTKIDTDDAETSIYGFQSYDIMHNATRGMWTCNCPGYTNHTSAVARSPDKHKHFLLVKHFVSVINSKYEGKHPVAGLYLKLSRYNDITEVDNPLSGDPTEGSY